MTPQSAPASPRAVHTAPAEAIPFAGSTRASRRSLRAPGRAGERPTYPGASEQEKVAPTIRLVTAKERLHRLVDELTDAEAGDVLVAIEARVPEAVRKTSEREGISVSAWLNQASVNALAIEDGLAGVAEWEAEHGPLSQEQLAAADAVLDAASIGHGRERHRAA